MTERNGDPLACTPQAIPADEREGHFTLARELLARAHERRMAPHGVHLRYDAEDLPTVARFVENERRCCPFLRFSMELEPGGGALWLGMEGPAGTRELLEATLPELRNAAST
jgi:hypothetical protein